MAIQDLKASLDLKQNLNIYTTCKQFDNLNLILSIFDNSLQADLTNYDVRLRAMKADNVPLIQEYVGITKNNNIVNIKAHEQLTTVAGNTPIELQFIDKTTGEKKATFNLVLVVVASTIAIEASISKATYTLLEELEKKLDQASDFFEHIGEAIEANTNLINSTNTANETREALDNSNTTALATKSALDTSNTNAINTKNELDTLNNTANDTKDDLNIVNQTGQTLLGSLETFEQEHADVTDISNQLASINADLLGKANNADVLTLDSTGNYAVGCFFLTSSNFDTYLYATKDGTTFKRLSNTPIANQHDGDMIYFNENFYFVTFSDDINYTVRVLKSSNLVDWETTYLKFITGNGDTQSAYGEKWLKDSNGKIYLAYGQVISGSSTSREIRPYIVEFTDLESLAYGPARELTLNGNTKIDPFIIKKDNTYYLFVKKERTEGSYSNGSIEIWTSNDLTTWTNSTYSISSLSGYSFEGACVNQLNGVYYLYLDNWTGDLIGGIVVCTSTDLLTWSEPTKILTDLPTKHGFVHTINDIKVKKIISNYYSENAMSLNTPSSDVNNYIPYYKYNVSKGTSKYSKLFSFKFLLKYNSLAVRFKVFDVSNGFYNSVFNLEVRMTTEGTYTYNFKEIENATGNAVSMLKLGLDNGLFTVYFLNNSVSSCPSYYINNINYGEGVIVSYNKENSFVDITGSIVSVPTKQITSTPNLRLSKIYESLASTSVTLSFFGVNGVAKIIGHSNGTTEGQMIDYNLILLAGNIGLVKMDTNGATISVTKNSYNAGVYNLTITVPSQYSIFDITLPVGAYFIS